MTNIVKVRYFSETSGEMSREYSYLTIDRLAVGDIVNLPIKGRIGKAKVSAIDIPESEIASFRDKVKTIPANAWREPVEEKPAPAQATLIEAVDEVAETPAADPEINNHEPSQAEVIPEDAVVETTPETDTVVALLIDRVEKMAVLTTQRGIKDNVGVLAATQDLNTIVGLRDAVEQERKRYTGPLNSQLKAINEFFKRVSGPISNAERTTRGQILGYNKEIDRQRREAERIDAAALELAESQNALQGEHTQDLTPVERPPEAPRHIETAEGSTSTKKIRKWELVDITLVPAKHLKLDEVGIGKLVRAGIDEIPGIRIYEEDTLIVAKSK